MARHHEQDIPVMPVAPFVPTKQAGSGLLSCHDNIHLTADI